MLETLFETEVVWLDDDGVRSRSEGAVVNLPKRPGRLDKLGARIRRHLAEHSAPNQSPFRKTLRAAGACVTG